MVRRAARVRARGPARDLRLSVRPRPRSGRRVVLLFVLLTAAALATFALYGRRAMSRSGPRTPLAAAAALVVSDNTAVGVLGGIRDVEETAALPLSGDTLVALAARVLGARGEGALWADVAERDGHWVVVRARLDLPGDPPRALVDDAGAPALAPPASSR